MVRVKLDEYFNKVNQEFSARSVQWNVVHGHYWVEIRTPTFRPLRSHNAHTHIPTLESQDAATGSQTVYPRSGKLAEIEEKKGNDVSADKYPAPERDEGEFENEISKLVRNEDKDAVEGKNAAMQGGILAKDK